MGRKKLNRTTEELREQKRIRDQRYYKRHTEECRKVYNIIAKYNTGDVTKEDAKKELADAVTHKTKFTKPIQDKVNEIMKEEQPKAKTKKIVTEN